MAPHERGVVGQQCADTDLKHGDAVHVRVHAAQHFAENLCDVPIGVWPHRHVVSDERSHFRHLVVPHRDGLRVRWLSLVSEQRAARASEDNALDVVKPHRLLDVPRPADADHQRASPLINIMRKRC